MDLYEILEIPTNATKDQITKAYRRLAKLYHPDKPNGDTEKFQRINYAYNILICDNVKVQYDSMKKPNKSKFILFLEEWFKKQVDCNKKIITKFFNINDNLINKIIDNIDIYDFSDLLNIFNKTIIPNKTNSSLDCSETETPYWDEEQAEYYHLSTLPLKYQQYNANNIMIELKCTLEEIQSNAIRKIKIKRKIMNDFVETTCNFNCSHPYIIFNNGGDNMDGHLIINLNLPSTYEWLQNTILLNVNINLFQYIYGISIPSYNIVNWIPYKDGTIINVKEINNYIYAIKLNTIYNDSIENKEKLENIN
jgi:curved DNA-binding protein CbpA